MKDPFDMLLFLLIALAAFLLGLCVGTLSQSAEWKRNAIAHGAAEYKLSGEVVEFHWNDAK